MNRFIVIGELVKAVGLKGEVKLYPLLDFHEPLLDSPYLVWEDGGPVEIQWHRQAGSCEAVKVRSVDGRNAAEALVGRNLGFMSESYQEPDFPRPAGGLPFRYLGRQVTTVAGHEVGTVDEVRFTGSNYLLVIPDARAVGREILIPAVEPILRSDEGLDDVLVIDPPEGLLDVQSG
ncbi:MAG: 16S rRNA processing protein RimM [Candidatus Krumholzibacteria bacterium]|nr:16S rRNA processing protein RimM [Candidatus Krumholzibacteria bacterium]